MMERRYNDRDAVVADHGHTVEQMLLGMKTTVTASGRRLRQAVDQLVQANRPEAARRRSNEYLPASEAHLGLRREDDEAGKHPLQVARHLRVGIRRRDVLAQGVER